MKRGFAVLFFLLMTGSNALAQTGVMAPPTKAQSGTSTQGTAPSETSTSGAREVEGTILSMDSSRSHLTLNDGTQLMIPDSLRAARDALKEGARVKATYEEQDGQKVATSITVWLRD